MTSGLSMGVSDQDKVIRSLAMIDANPNVLCVQSAGNGGREVGTAPQATPNTVNLAAKADAARSRTKLGSGHPRWTS